MDVKKTGAGFQEEKILFCPDSQVFKVAVQETGRSKFMFVFGLTVLSSILIISTIIVISYLQIRKNNQKTRTAVTDLYKLRSDFSVKQKIYDLYQPVFGAFSRTVRKSQALIAAEEFKEQFKLGRYIIFY